MTDHAAIADGLRQQLADVTRQRDEALREAAILTQQRNSAMLRAADAVKLLRMWLNADCSVTEPAWLAHEARKATQSFLEVSDNANL